MTDPPAPPPDSIGRYRIVERLATGAQGDVFKGFDPVLQRPLAIKLLRVTLDANEPAAVDRAKERFYREIQRVAALVHPSIARLFDGGETTGGFFIASEFIEGTNLADVIAQAPALDMPVRLSLLRQIAEALDYAREQDAPHLNLKTTNIIVCANHTVKVGGFGTARVQEAASTGHEWVTRFTAPEVAAGRDADARADVYSFGVVAAELLGGAPVIVSVLTRALATDAGLRYPTVPACFDALNAALGMTARERDDALEVPAAAAGLTPEQVNQIDSETTQAGVPTFAESTATDFEVTSLGMSPFTPDNTKSGDMVKPDADSTAPRLAAPPAPAASDPSEGKTILMPAPPKTPTFDRREVAPIATSTTPSPDPDADLGKTVLIPRKKADPSELNTAQMPALPKMPSADPPAVDRSELEATLVPSVPRAPKVDAPAPPRSDPAGDTVIVAAPADHGRTRASAARGAASPPETSELKTELIPSLPKAAAFKPAAPAPSAPPATAKRAVTAAPPPVPPPAAAAKPAPPQPIAFPPPPPAAPARAADSAKSSSGAGPLLAIVGLVAVLAVAVVIAWYTMPSLRNRVSTVLRTTPPSSTSAPAATASVTTTPVAASSVPAPEASATPVAAAPASDQPLAATASVPGNATPAVGSLRITSTPPGASVSIDGRRRGVTPLRVAEVTFGDHTVQLSLDGYNAENRRVSLSARAASPTVSVSLTKTVAAPETGAIAIVTEPAGARVIVDGAMAGTTPLTVANLAPGRHAVQAEREGFETVSRDVDVKAGETLPLALKLTAVALPRPAAPAGPIAFEAVEIKPRQTRGPSTPPYPRAAAQARLAGFVELLWTVDENGSVSDVQVVQASSSLFENEVVAWVKSLRYEPGRQGGKAVRVQLVRRFSFQPAR